MSDIVPLSFSPLGQGWTLFFGTEDAYDGDTSHYAHVQRALAKSSIEAEFGFICVISAMGVACLVSVGIAITSTLKYRRLTKQLTMNQIKHDMSSSTEIALDQQLEQPALEKEIPPSDKEENAVVVI